MEKASNRLVTLCCLIVIMAAGAGLRFYGIHNTEPFIADEAVYHLEARYLYSLLETTWNSLQRKAEERRTGENLWSKEEEKKRFAEDLEGKVPWFARPGHVYLLCAVMAILGPDKVYAGPVLSAVSGTLCIPLMFLLGRRLYGRSTGLLAAAFFSISGVQVLYARTGLTEQSSLVFFLLAVLFYANNRKAASDRNWGSLVLCGLSLGICFVVHYRMVIFIFSLLLLELPFWLGRRRESFRYALTRLAVLAGVAVVPIILTEFPYYLAMLFMHFVLKAVLPFQTYFEQLIGQAVYLVLTYMNAPNTGATLVNFLTYPYLLWKIEGPAVPLALLLTLILLLRSWRSEDGLSAVLLFAPAVLCTLFNPRTRYLSGFLPFANLLIAACLQRLWVRSPGPRMKWRQATVAAAAGIILVCGGLSSHKAMQSRVSYGKAMAFLKEQGYRKHVASHTVVSQVYMGVKNVPTEWPKDEANLRELYAQGYRYFVMDLIKDVIDVVLAQFNLAKEGDKFKAFQKRIDVMNRIEEETTPVFTCPNMHVDEVANVFEVNQNFPDTMLYIRKIQENPKARTIRVYDLKDYFESQAENPESIP